MHDLLGLSTDTEIRKCYSRDLAPTLANGRAVVIGDAAGPIQPQDAQAGTLSRECASALGVLFSGIEAPGQRNASSVAGEADSRIAVVLERAAAFDAAMRTKGHLTQLLSDYIPFQENDMFKVEARKKLEKVRKDNDMPTIPEEDPPFGDPVRDVLYTHNVVAATSRVMQGRDLLSRTPAR